MKRRFAVLTALLLLCGLTACGGAETQSGPGQSSTGQEEILSVGETSVPDLPMPSAVTTPEASGSGGERETAEGRVLVAYFSATGNTEGIALQLQSILDAELFEIIPEVPYTEEDLRYSQDDCRANREQNDPAARPAIAGTLENPEDYDVVFLGYPIWWGQAPKVVYTFLESCDLRGATIVPFCTSGSSGIGSSADGLKELTEDTQWLEGQRFDGGASQAAVAAWVEGLELPGSAAATENEGTRICLAFADGEAVAVLEDNAATRDFLAMLPVTLTFEDYAGAEKISYLSQDLSTEDAPASYDPQVGDVTLYAPWGNLAIFYADAASASGLVPLGRVVSGLDLLSAMDGEFEVSLSIAG